MPPFELALVLLSGLLHASWNAATKGSASPLAFLLAMEVVSLVLFLPILWVGFDPREIPTDVWGLLLASSAVHAFYAVWLARTYAHADLSIAYPIVRSTPALVPFIAVPFLGETITWTGGLGIGLVVAGLWMLTAGGRVAAGTFVSRGAAWAYVTLASTVAYSLIDKAGMERLAAAPWSSPLPRSLVFMTLMYALYLPGFCLLARRDVSLREVTRVVRTRTLAVCSAALVAFASYTLILRAMETAPVSYITAARQTSVLFALAIAVAVLKERPGRLRVWGGLANVAGVALIALSR